MQYGPRRGHIVTIFEHIISDYFLLFVAIVFGLVTKNPGFVIENAPILVAVLFAPVSRLVGYLCTTLEITDDKIVYKTGWLKKSVSEIPVGTVTTVDMTQNIMNQLTGTCCIAIDNAGNMAEDSTQVRMTFSRADAEEIRRMIKPAAGRAWGTSGAVTGESRVTGGVAESRPNGGEATGGAATAEDGVLSAGDELNTPDVTDYYKCPMPRLFVMGAMKSKGAFVAQFLALVFGGLGLFFNFFNVDPENMGFLSDWIDGLKDIEIDLQEKQAVALSVLLALGVLCVISIIGGGIFAVINYMDFTMWVKEDCLRIRYGFFTKKSYTIPKDRITGFEYKQSLVLRLMKVGMLNCIAIGYGSGGNEETAEESLLFPWIRDSEVEGAISRVLGAGNPAGLESESTEALGESSGCLKGAAQNTYRPKLSWSYYFIYSLSTIFGIIVIVAFVILNSVKGLDLRFLGIPVMLLCLWSCYLEYRNAALAIGEEMIMVKSGGFNTVRTYVRLPNLESVSEMASIFKKKKGLTSVTLNYMAPAWEGVATARNIPIEAFEETKKVLEM